MSEKKCNRHKRKMGKKLRRFLAGLLIFLFICLVVVLLVWAILQPKKPRFVLQDATIFSFNVSAPNLVSTRLQVTIYARNPNDKIGIYYDRFSTYATYHSQQITYYTSLPPVYQGHKDQNVWSPFVYGTNVPIAPYNGPSLSADQASGAIWLQIKIDGRVRWKVGSVTTDRYHIHITCPAYIPFGDRTSGLYIGTAIKYQLQQPCSVSI